MKNIIVSAFKSIALEIDNIIEICKELIDIGADDLCEDGFWILSIDSDNSFLSPNLIKKFDINISDNDFRLSKFISKSTSDCIKKEKKVFRKLLKKCNLNLHDVTKYYIYTNRQHVLVEKHTYLIEIQEKKYILGINKIIEKSKYDNNTNNCFLDSRNWD